jgi:hypothetical protein
MGQGIAEITKVTAMTTLFFDQTTGLAPRFLPMASNLKTAMLFASSGGPFQGCREGKSYFCNLSKNTNRRQSLQLHRLIVTSVQENTKKQRHRHSH